MFAAAQQYSRLSGKLDTLQSDREWREETPQWGDAGKQACRAQQTERTNGPLTDSGHRDRELEHAGA